MPEVVTKYPASLIKELKDVGGKCGEGLPPQILKSCPTSQLCVLPTGEVCVYTPDQIHSMTQISPAEWTGAVTGVPGMFGISNLLVMLIVLGVGLVFGSILTNRK